ncbi:hypothetical protein [Asaia platycodi]|uniref:hypothetical protein n=1 Tax=Asaia platycodi TaxID=610243 RepID=UPI000471E8F6|nr:hypothetical protein [Asaia platycodi]
MSLISGDVDNRAGTIQGQDKVTATISSLDNRDGGAVLSLGSDLILQNGKAPLSTVLNQGGTIGATGVVSLATQHYASDASSSLLGNGGMALSVSGDLDNQGIISSGTDLVLSVDRLINGAGGLIAAKNGDLTLTTTARTADALSNNGDYTELICRENTHDRHGRFDEYREYPREWGRHCLGQRCRD